MTVRQSTLTQEQKDVLKFIRRYGPRQRIVEYASENERIYLSQTSRELRLSKRTVLLQFDALQKAGIISSNWETRHIGAENRPVYLKTFAMTEGYSWLRDIYK